MKKLAIFVAVVVATLSYSGWGQTRQIPKPNYPVLPPPTPLTIVKDPVGTPPTTASFGLPFGQPATPSPEPAHTNRLKDVTVNLNTGTPTIPLPLYTLQEGSLSVPIGLFYSAVGMKAGEVAPWTGLGWTLTAGGMISRVVRGLPDEGKLQLNSFTTDNFTPRTGYYKHFYNAYGNGSNDNDKEPDLYYLNIHGQSYKMTFHPFREIGKQFVFFPEADIKVEPTFAWLSGHTNVGQFVSWKITMPDGTKYFFGSGNTTERSVEIEATFAKDNDIDPTNVRFSRYWKAEANPSAWYLTRIESPHGQAIDLEYRSVQYSFFKLAETENSGPCPTSTPDKLINKVYVQGQTLRRISSQNVTVEFNRGFTLCYTINGEEICETDANLTPARVDIDQWTKFPQNYSSAKKLAKMEVFDKTTGQDTLKYSFNYDHFSSDTSATYNPLPAGYSRGGGGTQIGSTHLFRLRLRSVILPQNVKYQFNYHFQDAPTTFYSRLTYGLDHWGQLNGNIAIPTQGLLGQDDENGCSTLPNRNSDPAFARYGLLKELEMQTDNIPRSRIALEYEAHQADNYRDASNNLLPIGGARIKAIATTDILTGISTTKRYTYTHPSGWPSGRLVMKPIYTFHDQNAQFRLNSGLYERLLSETNRPLVGYQYVKESHESGGLSETNPTVLGHTWYQFDQPNETLTLRKEYTVCSGGCSTFILLRPQDFHPAHDYRTGNLLETSTYNAADQLLQRQQMRYSTFKTDSLLAKKLFRINGLNLGSENNDKYYFVLGQVRADTTRHLIYNQTGQQPVVQTTTYQYKEDLPSLKYEGKHQMLVKTNTDNADGSLNHATTRYVADFEFGADSTFVPFFIDDDNGNPIDLSYWSVTDHVPTGADARAIYELKKANVLAAVVESTQERDTLVVGSSYQTYGLFSVFNAANSFRYFAQNGHVLQHLPLPATAFESVYFDETADNLVRDTAYYVTTAAMGYNGLGLPTEARAVRGPAQTLVYDASGVSVSSSVQNAGISDAQTTSYSYQSKTFGLSQITAPNGLQQRYEYYTDGRLKATKDQNNHLLGYQQYLYPGQTDPSSTVSEDFIFFFRQLTRVPRVATANPFLSADSSTTGIRYQTALGSQHHRRLYRQSPVTNTDIVSDWTGFDAFQRPALVDLPFPNDDPAVGADEYALYNDATPSQTVEYEASPLSRPKRGFGAGNAWRVANKAQSMDYLTNSSVVRKYSVAHSGSSVNGSSDHAVGTLFQQQVRDERGLLVQEFSDKEGRTVARWVQDTTDTMGQPHYLKTAYVYDNAGRLRYIVPPAIHEATPNFSEADAIFANGVYAYRYDGRGRVTEKHTPNAGWSYVVYNYLNQPVLTQDARQRTQNLWQWTKYDGHGRTVQTGTWTSTQSHQNLQNLFDTYPEDQQFEQRGGTLGAYTSRSFPSGVGITDNDIKAEYFYDDHTWASSQVNFANDAYMPRYLNSKGLLTGSKLRNTENNNWFENAIYYDDKNRIIQTNSTNHLGGVDQMDFEYNFVGEVLRERKIYRRVGETDQITLTTYTRDHAGRVTATTHALNGTEKHLANYEYDDIGRLKRKKISPFAANITRTATPPNQTQDLATQWVQLLPNTTITATATNTYVACIAPRDALQTVDYSYHIRGAVNCINCQNGTPTLNTAENDLFAMRLYFEEDGRYYNGQISKQSWLTPLSTGEGQGVRSYTYTYDQADRLKAGAYTGVGSENYTLAGMTYDQNGNIQSLKRNGFKPLSGVWGLIDDLTYNYGSNLNQLQSITESADNTNGFKTPSGGMGAYDYWPDGSLKKDLNKGISEITYNYLTLPQRVTFTDGRWIDFFYDAEGSKYKQAYSDGREYHYQGDLIYFKANGSEPLRIYEIQHDEGRVVSNGSSLVYEYGYYDHLGNLRVSYIDSAGVAVISQQNDYDPWGVPLTGLNRASRFANSNFYTFNGQEQLDFGYQNMGWRWMDNLTGRMSGIDPMDQFDSGYTGLGNNPIARIDPDGRIAPLVFAGAALVGGAINLASNWSKVKGDWRVGAAYFVSGAVGGMVAVTNPLAGGAVTSGSNAVIDIATGNVPQLNSPADYVGYVAKEAVFGIATAYVGGEVGKWIGPKIGTFFSWTQQGFSRYAPGMVKIGDQTVTWLYEGGVKASKTLFGTVGSTVGKPALKIIENEVVKRPSRFNKGVVEKVWKNSQNADGQVFDPTSGQEIIWNGSKPRNWDMGHVPGKEWFRLRDRYLNGEITWQQLLKEYNNPSNYRPELPKFNRANNRF